jgi:hypothetical protein
MLSDWWLLPGDVLGVVGSVAVAAAAFGFAIAGFLVSVREESRVGLTLSTLVLAAFPLLALFLAVLAFIAFAIASGAD